MDVSRIPGSIGQPPAEVKGPSFETLPWLVNTSPDVSYEDRRGNPLQETAPMMSKAPSNDSVKTDLMGRTANEINGGRTILDGGGTG